MESIAFSDFLLIPTHLPKIGSPCTEGKWKKCCLTLLSRGGAWAWGRAGLAGIEAGGVRPSRWYWKQELAAATLLGKLMRQFSGSKFFLNKKVSESQGQSIFVGWRGGSRWTLTPALGMGSEAAALSENYDTKLFSGSVFWLVQSSSSFKVWTSSAFRWKLWHKCFCLMLLLNQDDFRCLGLENFGNYIRIAWLDVPLFADCRCLSELLLLIENLASALPL